MGGPLIVCRSPRHSLWDSATRLSFGHPLRPEHPWPKMFGKSPGVRASLYPLEEQFAMAAQILEDGVGPAALRFGGNQVNAALTEADFVGLMRRLDSVEPPDPGDVRSALDKMLAEPGFEIAISRATADEESVRTRLSAALQAFATI